MKMVAMRSKLVLGVCAAVAISLVLLPSTTAGANGHQMAGPNQTFAATVNGQSGVFAPAVIRMACSRPVVPGWAPDVRTKRRSTSTSANLVCYWNDRTDRNIHPGVLRSASARPRQATGRIGFRCVHPVRRSGNHPHLSALALWWRGKRVFRAVAHDAARPWALGYRARPLCRPAVVRSVPINKAANPFSQHSVQLSAAAPIPQVPVRVHHPGEQRDTHHRDGRHQSDTTPNHGVAEATVPELSPVGDRYEIHFEDFALTGAVIPTARSQQLRTPPS